MAYLTDIFDSHFAPTGNATGATSDVVPWGGWPGGFPGDPNWAVAVVTVPWEVYKRSGKVQIVEEHYDAAHMFVQFLDTNSVNKSVRRVNLCFHSTRSLCGHGRLANLAGLCASSLCQAACPKCAETEPLYTMFSTADWLCCDIIPHCGDRSGPPGRCNANCPVRNSD